MALNQLFWSQIVARFDQNCGNDLNSDTDFEFDLYQKLVEFNRKWTNFVIFIVVFDKNQLVLIFLFYFYFLSWHPARDASLIYFLSTHVHIYILCLAMALYFWIRFLSSPSSLVSKDYSSNRRYGSLQLSWCLPKCLVQKRLR